MRMAEKIITAGGIMAVILAIGMELYVFVQWFLQLPNVYSYSVLY